MIILCRPTSLFSRQRQTREVRPTQGRYRACNSRRAKSVVRLAQNPRALVTGNAKGAVRISRVKRGGRRGRVVGVSAATDDGRNVLG